MVPSSTNRALVKNMNKGFNVRRRGGPLVLSRNTHNENPGRTGFLHSLYVSDTMPQREPAKAHQAPVTEPRPRVPVDWPKYQDVRDQGPLFKMSKMKLDPDYEKAKVQWHHLCVKQEEKQKIAYELWETNKELAERCYDVEAKNRFLTKELDSTVKKYKGLQTEIKRLSTVDTRDENTKQALRHISGGLDKLALDSNYLAGEVQRTRKAVEELQEERKWVTSQDLPANVVEGCVIVTCFSCLALLALHMVQIL